MLVTHALKMQKKIFDKNLQEMNLKVAYLENLIKEKDKEVKMQALKIRELMNTDTVSRKKLIKRDFTLL